MPPSHWRPLPPRSGRLRGGIGVAGGDAAVVGGEDDHRVVVESQFVEFGQHDSDGLVHGFDHTGIDGAVLDLADGQGAVDDKTVALVRALHGLLAILGPFLPGRLDGAVDRIEGEVGEERLVLVLLDEPGRFLAEPDGKRLAVGAVGEVRVFVGGEVAALGAAGVPTADVQFEAVVGRPGALAAEVPLAGEEGPVAALAEGFGEGRLFVGQVVVVVGGQQSWCCDSRLRLRRRRCSR